MPEDYDYREGMRFLSLLAALRLLPCRVTTTSTPAGVNTTVEVWVKKESVDRSGMSSYHTYVFDGSILKEETC